MSTQTWTIKDLIAWSVPYLRSKGSETARLDAELLLCEALQCRRLDLYLEHHKPLQLTEKSSYKELIRRRASGEPIAYILGRKEFFGLDFRVSPATLIPRPESEHLVEEVLKDFANQTEIAGLDIGTGTGCLALAILSERPSQAWEAWDISEAALEIARWNASQQKRQLRLFRKDALSLDVWQKESPRFDCIVSNPPYISRQEEASLSPSVRSYEPHEALFGEEDGLQFYKVLAKEAKKSLRAGGKIFLEIGFQQASAVCLLLESEAWIQIEVVKDLAGHDRVIKAMRPLQLSD